MIITRDILRRKMIITRDILEKNDNNKTYLRKK